jgi:hypothetical protein
MRRIKSIHQLQAEKRRIKSKQQVLEHNIRTQWTALKESFKPSNIAGAAFSSLVRNKTLTSLATDGIVKGAVGYGVSLLANQLVNKADGKWLNIFKRRK